MLAGMLSAADSIGPWLVCTGLDLFFLGVISTQIVRYFDNFGKSDPRWLLSYVAGLASITCVKSCFNFALIWRKIVVQLVLWDGVPTVVPPDLVLVKLIGISAILIVSTVCYVQGYYLYRLYTMSGRNRYLVAPIALVLLSSWCLAMYTVRALKLASLGSTYLSTRTAYYIYFAMLVLGDVTLTLSTIFFLLRLRQNALPSSACLVNKLIMLIFQSALPGTSAMVVNFSVTLAFLETSQVPPASSMILSKLWAFSLMWTLNARCQHRVQLQSVCDTEGGALTPTLSRENRISASLQFRARSGALTECTCLKSESIA
ncbi:hypothetical protein MIND_00640200 [Mycena indigotica]|uniref:DUF6534 domain-containing protein n=1 Tax=Mycena indigotica TaxID=2126181 RepID=A0A8H6SSH8_9AGAR|nr:uncharacterized protein MIND_00640200 [Mycena indigotica]KAF7304087.1 hypothetical protein MIND_00640200 [Mycena indigotica]